MSCLFRPTFLMLSALWGFCLSGMTMPAAAQSYGITDLGMLPGGTSSRARAMNDRGDVVGTCRLPGGTHAFLYHAGKMRDLGGVGIVNDHWTIDDNGRITFRAGAAEEVLHKFVVDRGVMTDLGPTPQDADRKPPFGGLLVAYDANASTNSSGVT